jgi:hypothetical protein
MNPNPYRTALLVLGILGVSVGGLFFLLGVTGSDVAASIGLGAIGGFLFSIGVTLLTLWLLASAVLYGLTITPGRAPRATAADWLGLSPGSATPPVAPSHVDEDGL